MPESIITTGADKLVLIINNKKKLSFKEAAKELDVGIQVIQEWAEFLEEEGIITIEYKFATPYLVKRELTRKEIEEKAKDFKIKKDSVIRKAESILMSIDTESLGFKKIKEEFDKLKKEMEEDIISVKEELEEFERYSNFKKDIDKQMLKDQNSFKEKLDQIHTEVAKKEEEYNKIIQTIDKKKEELEKEAVRTKDVEESESILREKLQKIIDYGKKIEKGIDEKTEKSKGMDKHIKDMVEYVDNIKKSIEKSKVEIMQPLIDQSKAYEKKISDIQKKVLDKVLIGKREVDENIKKSKIATGHFREFFDKKMKIDKLISDVENERNELAKEVSNLIKKAKAFELGLKSGEFKGHSLDLEKKLKEIEKNKGVFELALGKLSNFMKK